MSSLSTYGERQVPVIGVLDRFSQVAHRTIRSRTTQGRLVDACEYLAERKQATLQTLTAVNILDSESLSCEVLLVSRPSRPEELRAMNHAHRLGTKVVLDIDDDLTVIPTWSKLDIDRSFLDALIDNADAITVSNELLRSRFAGSGKVASILRTGFYVEKYSASIPPPAEGRFIFTMCNADNLKSDDFSVAFANLVYDFVDSQTDTYFDYFGDDNFPVPPHPRIRNFVGLSFEEHKAALGENGYALHIMMLGNRGSQTEATFFRSKSAVKYWEHGGFGIPGIFSESAIYRACIEEGRNGMMAANSEAAWLARLNYAYNNRDALRRMGAVARQDVVDNYHIRSTASDILALVSAVRR